MVRAFVFAATDGEHMPDDGEEQNCVDVKGTLHELLHFVDDKDKTHNEKPQYLFN